MSLRFAVLVLFPVFLLIGGCGSSGHSSSSTTSSSAQATSTTTSVSSTTETTAPTTTRTGAPSGPQNVRIPARFEVLAGGKLSPPQISIPAKLPIELVVVAKDGRPHHVSVLNAALRVPAGGQASRLIPGPKAGHYPIKLDGVAAGLLVTGVNPGP